MGNKETTALPNAPLAYFIGMARFPKFPLSEQSASEFQRSIRATFPHMNDRTLQSQQIEVSSSGDVHVESRQDRVWQFSDLERKTAFLLGDEFLALHTIEYKGHVSFAEAFSGGLEKLVQIPAIGLEVVNSVGVRYVDLIVPRDGEGIDAYLAPTVLPTRLHGQDQSGPKVTSSFSVGTYATDAGQLRYQVMHSPPFTVPPDLNSPLLDLNGWKPSRPECEFALLDIDHGMRFEPSRTISVEDIKALFISLRDSVNQVFRALVTEYAFQVWNNQA